MADLEKAPVITFRTDDSGMVKGVTSVKELKTAIAQLKDEIVRMRQAGEDTTKATTDLQAAQRELNTVMGLTKKGTDGVSGSYDSLVAKLRDAKTEWRALPKFINGELNPAWEKARQQVEQYNNQLKDMDASVGNFQRNVGNYKSALEGFSGTMGKAAQIGGDFKNGLTAMSSMLIMAGYDTEGMNDAMKALTITVGILQGMKGLSGLVDKVSSYLKESVKSTAATKADTVAKKANTTATNTMTVSETAAAGATTLLGAALKAIGIGLIVSALAFIVSHLEDIAGWLTGIGEKLRLIKKKGEGNLTLAEKTKKAYEDEKDDLDKQVKIMQAKGKSQKDILKFQIQQIDASIKTKEAELESANATLERLKQHNWLQRVLHGEQKEYREIKKYIEEATTELEEQRKAREEYNFDLELEGYREQTEGAKNAAQASEAAMKAIDDAAARAKQNIDKILDSNITGIEKIKKEYEALFAQLAADEKALIAKAAKDQQPYDGSVIASARLVLEQRKTEALRAEYKKQFTDKYKGYKDAIEIVRKEKDETDKVYKGLISTLRGTSEARVALERENSEQTKKRFKQDIDNAKQLLGSLTRVSDFKKYIQFLGKSDDELVEMYRRMLSDSEKFAKDWPEPFQTALSTIGPLILSYRDQTKADLTKFVTDIMSAYEEAVSKNDFKAAAKLKEQLLGNPPVADDEELQAAAKDFVQRMDKQMYEQIAENGNPLAAYLSGTTWGDVLQSQNEQWYKILNDETATWRQQWEARGNIVSEFARKYDKFLSTYGSSTANVLNNTANLWGAVIDAKQKDIDKQKEEGKISDKEHKRRTEQNKKSFENLKALQIGTAIINTAAAVVAALADMSVPFYVRLANSVAAGIAGAAEVVKIKSTDFSGGGSYSSNTSAPTLTQSAPMVNTYGINPADYAEANAANPVRVYVVESDITEAQKNARVRVSESTF